MAYHYTSPVSPPSSPAALVVDPDADEEDGSVLRECRDFHPTCVGDEISITTVDDASAVVIT